MCLQDFLKNNEMDSSFTHQKSAQLQHFHHCMQKLLPAVPTVVITATAARSNIHHSYYYTFVIIQHAPRNQANLWSFSVPKFAVFNEKRIY